MHFRGLTGGLALSLLAGTALAQSNPGFSYGFNPTPAQWNAYFSGKMDVSGGVAQNIVDGTLTRTYAGRPLNGATSNGTALSNSGNINWFGGATVQACSANPHGNPGTWVGCQLNGNTQAFDIYSAVEILGQAGAGIALAAATRSRDNSASNAYTIYDYAESDGTFNGTVPNESAEGQYIFAWQRKDPGTSNGFHYAIAIEADTQAEETLIPQGPYAAGFESFTANFWSACGGDYSGVRTVTFCSAAMVMLSQNVGAGALYDKGIIAAQNAFSYTHGPTADKASVLEMGAQMGIWWDLASTGHQYGGITSVATSSGNEMEIQFCNAGICLTDGSGNNDYQFTPSGFFNILGTAGSSRFISVEDAATVVTQFGVSGTTSGGNTGDNFFINAYSDTGNFLFTDLECIRGIGVCVSGQGIVVGGAISTTAAYGHMWGPTTTGTPTGTPNPPVAAAAYDYNTGSHTLNIYDPVAASWYHVALSSGGG